MFIVTEVLAVYNTGSVSQDYSFDTFSEAQDYVMERSEQMEPKQREQYLSDVTIKEVDDDIYRM